MKTMKTIYILAAFIGLQFNTIFAAGNFNDPPASLNNAVSNTTSFVLAPVTPSDAIFEEIPEMNSTMLNLAGLTPVVPVMNDFCDEAPVIEISVLNLTPVAPIDTEFEDETEINDTSSLIDLAPVAPVAGDFEAHV